MLEIALLLVAPIAYESNLIADVYPWLSLGTNTIIDLLWDPAAGKFKEMPVNSTAYWVDDQAKLLWLLSEDPITYKDYIDKILANLYSVWNNGYFPRRWVTINPKIISNDTSNVDIENGLLKVMGDLTGNNATNPIRVRYYEAAGGSDLFYLGGQLYIVDRLNQSYRMITYDPLHLRAEQCQNPGFDIWNSAWSNDTMMLPWTINYPEDWIYSDAPPMGCSYSTRWVFELPQTGRCIGLENYTVASRNWRSSEFAVSENTSYTLSFNHRGDFFSGGSFKVFLRWFSGTSFISQNYTEFSTSYGSWQPFSNDYVSPLGANCSDILFWSEADTNGNYYIDDVSVSGCTVLNGHFEVSHGIPVDDAVYHSRSKEIGRSLKLYDNYEYALEWLPVPVNTSRLYGFTFWAESAIPTTNLNFYVLYDDGTYSNVTKAINSTDWNVYAVTPYELSANKIVVSFGLQTQTVGIDTYIDDLAVHYKPVNAVNNQSVGQHVDSYNVTQYVEAVQSYEDDDVNFTIRFRFNNNSTYLQQVMDYKNKQAYGVQIYFTPALDGLSTVTSGIGTQETAYSSVWIPEVGRRSHTLGAYSTSLLDPSEVYMWKASHDYFIVELKQIPEWAGSYGIAVKVPVDHFLCMQNANANVTSPYLHYLTYTFRYTVPPSASQTFSSQIVCLDGYDFVNPAVYDRYLMNLEDYSNVDLSMCYHIGTIIQSLAEYYAKTGVDPNGMGTTTWDYYRSVFEGHNNGSYLLTTGKVIEASMTYYQKLGDTKYLSFALELGDYLVDLQLTGAGVRQGTFPMKHNNVTYLDCQAGSLIGLKLLRGYSIAYSDAYDWGLNAIHYGMKPAGFSLIFDPADFGVTVENFPRLFVYADDLQVDDDYFTFKSSYTARAALGVNDSFAMLALSRVWRNIVWIPNINLTVYVCEYIPGRSQPGTRDDWLSTNSETQPYGLIAWLESARYQRENVQYYYEFLEDHYAITYARLNTTSCEFNITGQNGTASVSQFYLKGIDDEVVPETIMVNDESVAAVGDLYSLGASADNRYYLNQTSYSLFVKAFTVGGVANLKITWRVVSRSEWWLPMMFILGIIGLLCMFGGPIYGIYEVKHGEYYDGFRTGLVVTVLGLALFIAWLWGGA